MFHARPIGRSFLCVTAALALGAAAQAQVTFQGLGDLPGDDFNSVPNAVSADGSVVVGRSESTPGRQAFRWEAGVMTGLGDLPHEQNSISSTANGVSADGSVVVGQGRTDGSNQAFRWEAGVMTSLGEDSATANGVSANGAVVVGRGLGSQAVRWEGGVATGLGHLPGGSSTTAHAVSADGSVVVGQGSTAAGFEAFRWEGGVMTGLGDFAGGNFNSRATGASADGSVVVGWGSTAAGFEAFRWEGGVMTGLGGVVASQAHDVSADGSVVVGASGSEAFVWGAAHGMRNLRDVLTNEAGLDLTGWTLTSARGISANGRAIVGFGNNPDGNPEAWRVLADAAWTQPTGGT